jgi:hypothetical protein
LEKKEKKEKKVKYENAHLLLERYLRKEIAIILFSMKK